MLGLKLNHVSKKGSQGSLHPILVWRRKIAKSRLPITYVPTIQLFWNFAHNLIRVLWTNKISRDFSFRRVSPEYLILHQHPNYCHRHPDSKVHGAYIDPGGPHVGPINLAIWAMLTIGYKRRSVNVIYISYIYMCFLDISNGHLSDNRRYLTCNVLTLIISSYLMKNIQNFSRCSHQDDTRSNQFPKGNLLSMESWKNSFHVIGSPR